MTSSFKKVNIFDDRLVMKEPFVPCYKGASNISKVVAQPTNTVAGQPSQITYNIPMIPSNYMPRYPVLHNKWQYLITITSKPNGTGAAIPVNSSLIAQGVDISMASYPFLTNLVSTAEVSINGTPMGAINMNRVAKKLLSIGEVKENLKYATCPSAPELYASVDDANLTLGNSQATFNDASWDNVPNGSYTMTYSVSGTTAGTDANVTAGGDVQASAQIDAGGGSQTVIVQCETWEPLVGLTPFVWDSKKDDAYSLFGMNNLILNLNLQTSDSKASRALRILSQSVLSTGAANSAIISFKASNFNMVSSELHYYLLRPPASLAYKVPRESSLHTYQYYYNSFTGSQALNGAQTVSMDNYVSSGMPTYMLVWADLNVDKSLNLNDFCNPISKLTMEMNGSQNILSLYNQVDLFNMSKDAGLQSTYLNFIGQAYGVSYANNGTPNYANSIKKLCSAPLVIRPSISFPLPEDISTNSSGSYNFKFTATIQPTGLANGATLESTLFPRLNVLCIYDAYVSIDTSTLECKIERCKLLPRDVLEVSESNSIVEKNIEQNKPLEENAVPDVGGALLAGRVNKYSSISSRLKRH